MRKLTLSICICLITFFANAQTSPIMVCNATGSTCAPFFNLDTAISHASNGDYIYLPGGNYTISDTIKKELHIYGTGIVADSSLYIGGVTTINSNLVFSPLSSNSSVTGIITNNITLESPSNALNFTITRAKANEIYLNVLSGAIYIKQNLILTGVKGNSVSNSNILIANNIFPKGDLLSQVPGYNCYNQIYYIRGACIGMLNGATIKNNVIFPSSPTVYGFTYTDCGYNSDCGTYFMYLVASYTNLQNCIIKNNIFKTYNNVTDAVAWLAYPSSSNNVFNNNLITPSGYSGYNASLSFAGASSQSFNMVDSSVSHAFDSLLNCDYGNQVGMASQFKLQVKSTSLGHNAGDDNTDVGIFGGTSPWKAGAIPSNPHIYYKLINGTTNTNGDLPVNIKARGEN